MKSKQFFSRILIGTLLIFSFFSCQKEEQNIFNQNSITDLTSNFTGEALTRTQLRLAFGKTVANALVHPEFRKYIKETSETDEFKGFNEIVFALHQNDQVTEELTLRGLLNAAIDEEVKELFGDFFLEIILKEDPLVCIKLPDIFYTFDWDFASVTPMVSVKTPSFIPNPDDNNYDSYQWYHASGYNELISPQKDLKYFCLVIKYSEDYLLWDDFLLQNEKGLSLFEFLPQAETCWDEMKTQIEEASLSVQEIENIKFLKKRDFFYLYQQLCEPGHYFSSDCGAECNRDCPDTEQVTTVLKSIELAPVTFPSFSHKSPIYNEVLHLGLPMDDGDTFQKPVTIIGFRDCEFYNLDFTFEYSPSEHYFENLGKFYLPKITFDITENEEKPPIKKDLALVLFTDFPVLNNLIEIHLELMRYEDVINPTLAAPSRGIQGWWAVNPSSVYLFGDLFINRCYAPNEKRFPNGNAAYFTIKY